MRASPIAMLGWGLIIFGAVVLVMRGVSYTRERQALRVGPMEVTAERRGFIPPVAGFVAILAGGALVVVTRRRG